MDDSPAPPRGAVARRGVAAAGKAPKYVESDSEEEASESEPESESDYCPSD